MIRVVLGLALIAGCVDGTPGISDLSIDSPIDVSGVSNPFLNGELRVVESTGTNDLHGNFTFIDASGASTTFATALTPGGNSDITSGDVSFAFGLSPASAAGTYTVTATVTDDRDDHASNELVTTVVIQ